MLMKLIKLILFLALLWGAGLFYFFSQIATESPNTVKYSDAIIVLTGGKNRIKGAVDLLRTGDAPKLFISGVDLDVKDYELFDQIGVDYVDSSKIELGYEATDTFGNVTEAEKWIKKNDVKSIILVTANYHMPRAYSLFSGALPDVEITKYPTISPDVELQGWLGDEQVRGLIISEYNKYLLSF